MKNYLKRSLSMLLALVMLLSPFSGVTASAHAEELATEEVIIAATEAVEATVAATEPSEVPTEPAAEVTESATEAVEPTTQVTEPVIEATEAATEAVEPTVAPTEAAAEVTEPIVEETTSGTEDVIYTDGVTDGIEAATSTAEEEVETIADAEYSYNTGIRGETCTELSAAAKAFYTGEYTYENLSELPGAADTDETPTSALYEALQTLMVSKHTHKTTYGETRYQYQYTDCQDGGNWEDGKISSFYSGTAIGPDWDGGSTWNREHTWPNSKGLGGSDENDIMMLRPTSKSENSSRSNKAYGESSGYYHPNSESDGTYDVRGDVARIFLYIYVRWGNVNGNGQKDSNDNAYTTWGTNGVMESKEVLLKWMEADPVDTWELGRNDVVQEITGTRNVFVDYPELAFMLFEEEIPDSMPSPSNWAQVPAEPSAIVEKDYATGGGILTWEADSKAAYYEIYRKTSSKDKYKYYKTVTEAYAEVGVSVGKTYYYKIKAICKADPSLSSDYSNAVKVTGKCAQPEVTVQVKASSGKPYVDWEKIKDAEKYYVYRATSKEGEYEKIKTTTKTAYTDSPAKVGKTYYYKVKAIASKSSYNSAYSEIKECVAICGQPNVELSIKSSSGKPVIQWEKVSGAISYEILRADSEENEYVKLDNQSETGYTDISAESDKDYWYKVNAIGTSEELNSIDGTAKKIHATLAKPIVNFGINSVSGKPVLTWGEVEGAVGYKIYRSTSASKSYKAIGTTTELAFSDSSASVGKAYYYKVIAIGENCKSAYSSYKKLTAKCARPEVTVKAKESSGKPYVDWDKITGAEKYYVYRATSEDGDFKRVKSTTKTAYTDTSAKVGKTYYYKVKAVAEDSDNNSAYSEVRSCVVKCAAPEVTIKTASSSGKPYLTWKQISNAEGYMIYRSENGGAFELLVSATGLKYTDKTAEIDCKYTYKVEAVAENADWNSVSSEVSIVCACAKPEVTVKLSNKKPSISWEAVEGATEYEIYRSTKKSSGFKKIDVVEEGETYRDSKAKKGTTYYYKVIAVSDNAKSAYSNTVKIKSK